MDTSKRNYGIDFLRILSMWMIPAHHVLLHGGILKTVEPQSAQYQTAWFLEIASYCAVNCFALISGYVGVEHRWKWSNMVQIHLQVSFYCLLLTAIFGIASIQPIGIGSLLQAAFPVIFNQYWYFTAYFALFFFIPFMNELLLHLSRRQLCILIATITAVFSVLSIHFDPFRTQRGYSALWLGLLYLMGGALRLLGAERLASPKRFLLIYFLSVLATWGSKLVIEHLGIILWGEAKLGGLLVEYTSPTIVLAAVSLLLCCAQMRISPLKEKFTTFFSPMAFGVYLIHDNGFIRGHIIMGRFSGFASYAPWKLFAAVLAAAFAIWLICSLIDYLRLCLFRVLGVKKLCCWVDEKLPSFYP